MIGGGICRKHVKISRIRPLNGSGICWSGSDSLVFKSDLSQPFKKHHLLWWFDHEFDCYLLARAHYSCTLKLLKLLFWTKKEHVFNGSNSTCSVT